MLATERCINKHRQNGGRRAPLNYPCNCQCPWLGLRPGFGYQVLSSFSSVNWSYEVTVIQTARERDDPFRKCWCCCSVLLCPKVEYQRWRNWGELYPPESREEDGFSKFRKAAFKNEATAGTNLWNSTAYHSIDGLCQKNAGKSGVSGSFIGQGWKISGKSAAAKDNAPELGCFALNFWWDFCGAQVIMVLVFSSLIRSSKH